MCGCLLAIGIFAVLTVLSKRSCLSNYRLPSGRAYFDVAADGIAESRRKEALLRTYAELRGERIARAERRLS